MMQPRVLLIEDDASVRRFVTMALDEADIEIIQRDSLKGAIDYLFSQAPVDLVLSDLTLTDGSAIGLIEWLTLHRGCRVAVFSAGITPQIRTRLKHIGVWRILDKPVSLSALHTCISQGTEPSLLVDMASTPPPSASAVDAYFGGDKALFCAYAESCMGNFAIDLQTGEKAVANQDLNGLKCLAHSLKTVLTMIGQEEHAATARMLEQSASNADLQSARHFWLLLRDVLSAGQPASQQKPYPV